MTAKKKDPVLPIRPHTYTPDFAQPADWRGNRLCSGCSLPKDNRVHDFKPAKDNSARIIGESED